MAGLKFEHMKFDHTVAGLGEKDIMKQFAWKLKSVVLVAVAGVMLALPGSGGLQGSALAAEKVKMSDKEVKALMTAAFRAMPDHVKRGNKVVKIEKDKPEKVLIPVADARRIIKAARVSALAELCSRTDLALLHRNAILALEIKSKKWSDQQIKFMERLHLLKVLNTLAPSGAKSEADAKKKTAALAKKLCNPKIVKQIETRIKLTQEAIKKK